MLRKLWKYEYRSTARMMWILVACLCGVIALTGALVFFSSRFFAARNTLLSEELQGLLGGCTALIALFLFYIITAGSILCSVFLFVRFYQDVATDRAYLYFTTPTTGAQKLSAKLLCGYFWKFLICLLTAVGLLCIAALGIYGSGVDFSFLRELTAALAYGFSGAPLQAMVFAVVAVLHLLLQPLYQLLVFYFAISLGAVVARRMRLLVSFGFFVCPNLGTKLSLSDRLFRPVLCHWRRHRENAADMANSFGNGSLLLADFSFAARHYFLCDDSMVFGKEDQFNLNSCQRCGGAQPCGFSAPC